MEVKYNGKDKMFLHQEIGKGMMPDGRKCRLIQTNAAIHFEVYSKNNKGWDTYSLTYLELSKEFVKIITEKESKRQ